MEQERLCPLKESEITPSQDIHLIDIKRNYGGENEKKNNKS